MDDERAKPEQVEDVEWAEDGAQDQDHIPDGRQDREWKPWLAGAGTDEDHTGTSRGSGDGQYSDREDATERVDESERVDEAATGAIETATGTTGGKGVRTVSGGTCGVTSSGCGVDDRPG